MDAFLTRYYAGVRKWLGDPTVSKRLTDAQLLDDFYEAEVPVWEDLMMAGGAESVIGRAEAPVTLEDAQGFYALPGSFRQFYSLMRWGTQTQDLLEITGATYDVANGEGDEAVVLADAFATYCWRAGDKFVITAPSTHAGTYTIAGPGATVDKSILLSTSAGGDAAGTVAGTIQRTVPDKSVFLNRLMSISENEPGPGVLIIDAERGMMVRPVPTLDDDVTFTLTYQKGPIRLHYGTAAAVSADTLTFDATPTDGEVIAQPGYYVGSMVRVYGATLGAPQVREIIAHDATWDRVQLARPWNPTPTGTVLYEITPALPPAYDSIYALDVASKHAAPRRNPTLMKMLRELRVKLWSGCVQYVLSGVADRAPARTPPVDYSKDDPYDFCE